MTLHQAVTAVDAFGGEDYWAAAVAALGDKALDRLPTFVQQACHFVRFLVDTFGHRPLAHLRMIHGSVIHRRLVAGGRLAGAVRNGMAHVPMALRFLRTSLDDSDYGRGDADEPLARNILTVPPQGRRRPVPDRSNRERLCGVFSIAPATAE